MSSGDQSDHDALVLAQRARIRALEAIIRVQRKIGESSPKRAAVEHPSTGTHIGRFSSPPTSIGTYEERGSPSELAGQPNSRFGRSTTEYSRDSELDRRMRARKGDEASDQLVDALKAQVRSQLRDSQAAEAERLKLVRRLGQMQERLSIAQSQVAQRDQEESNRQVQQGATFERARLQYRRDVEELEGQLELHRAKSRRLERELEDARHQASQEVDAATAAHHAVESELRTAIDRASSRSDSDRQEAIRLRSEAAAREHQSADDVRILREEMSLLVAAAKDDASRWKAEALRARKVAAKLRAEVQRLRGHGAERVEHFRGDVMRGVAEALEREDAKTRRESDADYSRDHESKDAWVRRHVGSGWVSSDGFGASVGSARRYEQGFGKSPAWH